ncbi:MAG: HPF/RaiA family ribosome-associated protein [Opitutales bacterium]
METPLEITVTDIEKKPDLEALIRERASRLEKVCEDLVSCHVGVSKPHAHQDSGSGYRVRIEARVPPNQQFLAKEHSSHGELHDEVETVIRRAFDAVERQLKEFSERVRDDRRGQADEEDVPGTVVVIDKKRRFGIVKTMAGRNVYFDAGAVLNDDFDRIEIGTAVRYEDEPGDLGPRATTVQIVDKRGQPMVAPDA